MTSGSNEGGAVIDLLQTDSGFGWVLESTGYDPLREGSLESRFAISNGFLGIRGGRATTRGSRWVVPARTYVAGLFDISGGDPAVAALVPAADWLDVRILLAGQPLMHHPNEVSSHRMILDMKRGTLLSRGHHVTSSGVKGSFHTLRMVALDQRSVGLQLIQFEIEEGAVEITFEASSEGKDLGLVEEHIDPDLGVWRTRRSGRRLAMAIASSLRVDGQELAPAAFGPLMASWRWQARPGQTVSFERIVAIVRSDAYALNPEPIAREKLALARQVGSAGIVAAHQAAWACRWNNSDVEVEGDTAAQLALRFALYHLNSAANPKDERVSVGARALTGDQYHGHVFWDTEIYLLPFYTLTWPEAARAMLMYRFHTLDAAREKARVMGWRGALYAWESADTGEEMTPEQVVAPDMRVVDVLCGKQEQHISADIACAVWQYCEATADETFLCQAGAEILLETARFWSSRAKLEADGQHHIRGVIGPDEYHEHIDDNAYTNVMARWNIRRAIETVSLLRQCWPSEWERISGRLQLDDAELRQWQLVAETMATGRDSQTGLFAQFAGYFALEDIDLQTYAARTVPMDMVLGRDRIQASQVLKQADVVALLALLPEEFAAGSAESNFRYYEPRCCHGSSLSPAIHGLAACRLDEVEMALRYFRQTASIDLADTSAATDGGVHIAALGGLWMLAVFGFAGLSIRDDGVALEPHPPPGWRKLAFRIQWRGRHLKIRLDQDGRCVDARLETGDPMSLWVAGKQHKLERDRPLRVDVAYGRAPPHPG